MQATFSDIRSVPGSEFVEFCLALVRRLVCAASRPCRTGRQAWGLLECVDSMARLRGWKLGDGLFAKTPIG